MEAKVSQSVRPSPLTNKQNYVRNPSGFVRVSQTCKNRNGLQMFVSSQMQKTSSGCNSPLVVKTSTLAKNYPASALKSGGFPLTMDDALILKNKTHEIQPYLDGRCIYLVGMMGSGKTTIGRILADILGYTFYDSDMLIEQAVGGVSVSEIFKLYGEGFFRDNETEVLRKLSSMRKLVVSTGGGAVTRPINWNYMRGGISVWLDVPLEALAKRITAVGTGSRPLLHNESGDAYSKTFRRLLNIMEERIEAYANANARVSLECVATKLGLRDVSKLSPVVIAIEALEQIESFLKEDGFAI